ncbi:UNVERIFIED_CONTAM: leuB [Trichonephila clavipes]
MAEAEKVLGKVNEQFGLGLGWSHELLGGAAIDAHGVPLPDVTLDAARKADAVLLGAVGGPKWDQIERSIRPERGLLKIRAELNLFANLRPAILYPQLAHASSLKTELVAGLDILIVRELTGGIYFGQPRGIRTLENGERQGYNTDVYSESEIRRIAHVAFQLALQRNRKLLSVDKANVLEVTELWKQVVNEPCHGSAPDIAGQGVANPLATILSVAMMLRYSFGEEAAAKAIEDAVGRVLDQGLRTPDIWSEGTTKVGTQAMGDAVVNAL